MKILITGGTGFIGRALCAHFLNQSHDIYVLTRNIPRAKKYVPDARVQFIDNVNAIRNINGLEVVINLAGAPIAKRWTHAYKTQIIESRVGTTQLLIDALSSLQHPPNVFISGSAIGYYGIGGDEKFTEQSKGLSCFSHDLCKQWEKVAEKAKSFTRVCCIRTGIVLGNGGGALKQMRLPFLLGIGGPMGTGKQWMSWIHIKDYVSIIEYCMHHDVSGPVNATAPEPVQNDEFARTYASVLHRPALLSTPAFVLKRVYGQMAEELLLGGQRVIPDKLLQQGFHFSYSNLKDALVAIEKPE